MRKISLLLSLLMIASMVLSVGAVAAQPAATTATAPAETTTATTPTSNYAVPFEINEDGAYYMVEQKTDTLIFAQNEHEKMYPASLTKIMTAILTLENCPDLTEKVTYKLAIQDSIYQLNVAVGGGLSLAGFSAGEEITIKDLLYATLLPSGNEAAEILADHVGGSGPAFYEMMNEKAKELGARNTNFCNANGLFNENHYTTAYDMYLIASYAMENDTFAEIASTVSYTSEPTNKNENGYTWYHTNKMMNPQSEYYSSVISGVKTGTLDEAGRCLITTAEKSGYQYMLVLLGAELYDEAGEMLPTRQDFIQTDNFYNWAFENYKVKTVIEKGTIVYDLNLRLAKDNKKKLQLMSGSTFSTLMPQSYNIDNVRAVPELDATLLNEDKSIDAPIQKGDVVGELKLILSGKEIGRVDLLAAETVERSEALYLLDQVKNVFNSFAFKFFFLFVMIFLVIYVVIMVLRNHNKRKYRRVKRRRRF